MPKIHKIKDNIVTIQGSFPYKQNQIFELAKNTNGIVLSASEEEANLLVVGDSSDLKINTEVISASKSLDVIDLYEGYFGSIISPWGKIIVSSKTNKGKKIGSSKLDGFAPSILERVKLDKPLKTGILAIDSLVSIGMGQRELIIGDRTTGKTSIALSTIINQTNNGVKTIYVAIGKKRSSIISIYNLLKKYNAEKNVVILFSSLDSSSEQFLAPKIGMAMAESLAHQGEDVLVVLDDLTKHANIYREIALTIGKNPGREAYPTDIFFQHSKLLERAGSFNEKYKGGSITCLPIIETINEDVAALIPSNAVSITDGQIFTSIEKFNKGLFPAISIERSVSRTGSSVQTLKMKPMSAYLKEQFFHLLHFQKFVEMSIDISKNVEEKIQDWKAINNAFVQFGYEGYSEEHMAIILKMFKLKFLNYWKDSKIFSTAFNMYCKENLGAQKILHKLKNNLFHNESEIEEAVDIVFRPLSKISSGIEDDILTLKEFKRLSKGEVIKNDR